DFALARYNADGSLDTNLATGFGPVSGAARTGKVTTDFGSGTTDRAFGLAIPPDGKMVVAGSSGFILNDASMNFAVPRYNPDGSLDTDFVAGFGPVSGTARTGKVTTDFGFNQDLGSAVLIQPNGMIVVAGSSLASGVPGATNFALVRYDSHGVL